MLREREREREREGERERAEPPPSLPLLSKWKSIERVTECDFASKIT
jgi:hypothetical protein